MSPGPEGNVPAPGDDRTPDEPIEQALARALEHRAGGSIDAAGGPAAASAGVGPVPEPDRLAAIEAAVASPSASRQRVRLGAVAAAIVVLLVVAATMFRSSDDAEVTSIAGEPATDAPVPGTDPVGTSPVGGGAGDPATSSTTATLAPPAGPEIESVDLRNFTYPSSLCPNYDASVMPVSYTLVDGEARVPYTVEAAPDVALATGMGIVGIAYGDVTGDGTDDALVQIGCGYEPGDDFASAVAVVSMVGTEPTVIGSRGRSGRSWMIHNPDPVTGEDRTNPAYDIIMSFQAVGGHLAIRWDQTISPMGYQNFEHRQITVTYGWNGTEFIAESESDVVIVPAQSPPPLIPIDQVDFASIDINLDHGRWGKANSLCGWAFRDVTPVDATLVDGAATVRDASGAELGSVHIEQLDLVNLDDDVETEGLARVRCTTPTTSVLTVAVFEPGVEKHPNVFWSTTEVNGYDDVHAVQINDATVCPLTIGYGWSAEPTYPETRVSYRREWAEYRLDESCPPS